MATETRNLFTTDAKRIAYRPDEYRGIAYNAAKADQRGLYWFLVNLAKQPVNREGKVEVDVHPAVAEMVYRFGG